MILLMPEFCGLNLLPLGMTKSVLSSTPPPLLGSKGVCMLHESDQIHVKIEQFASKRKHCKSSFRIMSHAAEQNACMLRAAPFQHVSRLGGNKLSGKYYIITMTSSCLPLPGLLTSMSQSVTVLYKKPFIFPIPLILYLTSHHYYIFHL